MVDRKKADKKYESKRLTKPAINGVRDVPQKTVDQLDFLEDVYGTKKLALIEAINVLFTKENSK